MINNFPEINLSQDFCTIETAKAKDLINHATSFTVVGMPALGISIFLRYLCTQSFANFYYVDIYELPSLTTAAFCIKLAQILGSKDRTNPLESCKKELLKLSSDAKPTVIVFSRFTQLQKSFTKTFFNNLRSLRDVDKSKIVFVFSSNIPLLKTSPQSFDNANLNMYSSSLFLKPFLPTDLKSLLRLNSPTLNASDDQINLSGGHYQLLQLILKTDYAPNYLKDPAIRLQMQEILDSLNSSNKQQLQRLALGKNATANPYLLSIGVINSKGKFFTPILSEYLLQKSHFHFTPNQTKLFQILKQNINKIVTKDTLFNALWPNSDVGSDWALDTLIHRLRQNHQFKSKFVLESYKRVGYKLVRI